MYKIIKNIFLSILLIFLGFNFLISQAGVVPGTIQKGAGSTSVTCGTSSSSYSPSDFSCPCILFKEGSGPPCGCASWANSCDDEGNCSSYCSGYNTCRSESFGCEKDEISLHSSLTYTNYHGAISTKVFGSTSFHLKLGMDINEYCYAYAYGTMHTPPGSTGKNVVNCPGGGGVCTKNKNGTYTMVQGGATCTDVTESKGCVLTTNGNLVGSASMEGVANCPYSTGTKPYYKDTGSNGECLGGSSLDNLISTFNQYGAIKRIHPTGSNTTCTVEGRYAQKDDTPPKFEVNKVKDLFTSDENKWCNIKKYIEGGYTSVGCEYYRKLNTETNPTLGQDLLKGLEIKVFDDLSGVGEIQIILGNCGPYSYKVDDTSLENIVKISTSPEGVKPTYSSGFTIKYNTSFIAMGGTQKSLLEAFNVDRLDKCLVEGKNSLLILTKDMARSEYNGIDLSPNISEVKKFASINIDYSYPLTTLTGDLSGSVNIWKNYSLTGSIQQGEKYGGPNSGCSKYEYGTGTCGTPTAGMYWVRPVGVNEITGVFNRFKCDDTWFPTKDNCALGCPQPGKMVNGKCQLPINGECGTAHETILSIKPSNPEQLCSKGTPSIVNGTGPWNWTCEGIGTGDTANCSANKAQNATCGSANGTMVANKPTENLCGVGTPSTVEGTGPWNWTCTSGSNSVNCSANKQVGCTPDACPTGYSDDGITELYRKNIRTCSPTGTYKNYVGVITIQGTVCASAANIDFKTKGYWSLEAPNGQLYAAGCTNYSWEGLKPICTNGSKLEILSYLPAKDGYASKTSYACYLEKQTKQSTMGKTTSRSFPSGNGTMNECDEPDSTNGKYIYCDLMSSHGYGSNSLGYGPFCKNGYYKYMISQVADPRIYGKVHYEQGCLETAPAEPPIEKSCSY